MASHDYRFLTRWRVDGSPEDVYAVIDDVDGYVRWWPSVWLDVETLGPGDADGVGKTVLLTSKGWLPYVLVWTATTVEKRWAERIAITASGDFDGTGVWTFAAEGSQVVVEYDWRVRADRALLRRLSPVLRPLFGANHDWAMERGEESLRLEMARRRARTEAERSAVAPPPRPTFMSPARRRRLGLPVGPLAAG